MAVLSPLFLLEADAFLDHGTIAAPMAGGAADSIAAMRADWLRGVDHAPPWRVLHKGLGLLAAPMPAEAVSVEGVAAAGARAQQSRDRWTTHFLPDGAMNGRAALSLTLDQHSIAGAPSAPILQVLSQFALHLADELDSQWVAWAPARIAYPRAFLTEQMAGWHAGGRIPLLPFVRFDVDAGGADVTDGLVFFGLPELRFKANTPMGKGEAVRRMIRMAYAMLADSQLGLSRDWDGPYDGLAPGERMEVRRRGDRINLTSIMPE